MRTVSAEDLSEHRSVKGPIEEPLRLRPYILTLVSRPLQNYCVGGDLHKQAIRALVLRNRSGQGLGRRLSPASVRAGPSIRLGWGPHPFGLAPISVRAELVEAPTHTPLSPHPPQ